MEAGMGMPTAKRYIQGTCTRAEPGAGSRSLRESLPLARDHQRSPGAGTD